MTTAFAHSFDMGSSLPVKVLVKRYGCEGYTAYFRILETLSFRSELSLALDSEDIKEVIAEICYLQSSDRLIEIIETCVGLGLLDGEYWRNDRRLVSPHLADLMLDDENEEGDEL